MSGREREPERARRGGEGKRRGVPRRRGGLSLVEKFVVAIEGRKKKGHEPAQASRSLFLHRPLHPAETPRDAANLSRARASGRMRHKDSPREAAAEAPSHRCRRRPLATNGGPSARIRERRLAVCLSLRFYVSLCPREEAYYQCADIPGQKGALTPQARARQRPCFFLYFSRGTRDSMFFFLSMVLSLSFQRGGSHVSRSLSLSFLLSSRIGAKGKPKLPRAGVKAARSRGRRKRAFGENAWRGGGGERWLAMPVEE